MSGPRAEPRLEEIGSGVYAYLQQGGWGYSNAGLVADQGESLLIDTLYDVRLTVDMLSEMRRREAAAARIGTVVNTHANGDHCWGNQVMKGARIVSSRKAADEMKELSPRLMATLVGAAKRIAGAGPRTKGVLGLLGRLGVPRVGPLAESAEFVVDAFGSFEYRGIELTLPTETFEGQLDLTVGGKRLQLIEVGPAHTKGDAIVFLPDERVAFTGDILFIGSHPIIWEGPVQNWIRACDRLLALDVDVVVPGHGPLTTKMGVQRTKEYWEGLVEASRKGREAGASPAEIARELLTRATDGWTEASRLAVNVDTICRDLAGDTSHREPLAMIAQMARLEAGR